jgi:hypothetical protein
LEGAERVVAAAFVEGAFGEQHRAPRQIEVAARAVALVELVEQHLEIPARRKLALAQRRGGLGGVRER